MTATTLATPDVVATPIRPEAPAHETHRQHTDPEKPLARLTESAPDDHTSEGNLR